MNNNNSNNGFTTGLLIGIIIGAAAVFLLGTKKGKKLLNAITDEGLDEIADVLGDNFQDEEEELASEEVQSQEIKHKEHTNGETKKSPMRRFFKGVSKRS